MDLLKVTRDYRDVAVESDCSAHGFAVQNLYLCYPPLALPASSHVRSTFAPPHHPHYPLPPPPPPVSFPSSFLSPILSSSTARACRGCHRCPQPPPLLSSFPISFFVLCEEHTAQRACPACATQLIRQAFRPVPLSHIDDGTDLENFPQDEADAAGDSCFLLD